MRSVDRLEKNRREEARRRAAREVPEELETEMQFPPVEALDRARSVFDRGLEKRWGGINTAPSVFDRQAVFRTKKDE